MKNPMLQEIFDDSCYEMILSPGPEKMVFQKNLGVLLLLHRLFQLINNAGYQGDVIVQVFWNSVKEPFFGPDPYEQKWQAWIILKIFGKIGKFLY